MKTGYDQYHIKKHLNIIVKVKTDFIFVAVIDALRKISAIVLIPLMVFASGGLNIFSHYCHTHQEESFSLIETPSCEHKHNSCCEKSNTHSAQKNHADCCDKQKSHCCEKEVSHCSTPNGDPVCCENEHKFVKTVEWNLVENPLEIEKSICELQTLISTDLDIPEYDNSIPMGFRYVDFSSPPEYSPKYITVFQQKLRIAC